MKSSDPSVRQKIAERLLKQATNPENTPAMRYVLLIESATLFAKLPDVSNVMTALDNLSETFAVTNGNVKLEILQKARKHCRTRKNFASLASAYRSTVDGATQADKLDIAIKASRQFVHAARLAKDPALFREAMEMKTNVRKMREAEQNAAYAKKLLSREPQNAKANQIVGEYLCFTRGNWDSGLPYLVKASSKELSRIAQTDVQGSQTPKECVALGDNYFERGRKESWSVHKANYLRRARMYYEKALPDLGGILKEKVNKRIEQCAEISTRNLSPSHAAVLPASLRKGLVLHYSFDMNPRESVKDKSGKKHNGVPWKTRWMSTDMHTAVNGFCSFDGTGGISVPCPLKLGAGNITLAFWAKLEKSGGCQYLFSNKNDYHDNFLRLGLDRDSSRIRVYSEEDRNRRAMSVSSYSLDNRWRHIVLTRQGDTGMLYVDGRLVDTLAMKKGNIGVESEWCIGASGAAKKKWPEGFMGFMDEIAIWNHTLSKRGVRQLYRSYGNTYSPQITKGQITLDLRGKRLQQFLDNADFVSWTGKTWSRNVRDHVKTIHTKDGVVLQNDYKGHHILRILFPIPCKPGMTMTIKGQDIPSCGVLDVKRVDNWAGISYIGKTKPEVVRIEILENGFQCQRNGETVNPKMLRDPEVGYFAITLKRGEACRIQRIQFSSLPSRQTPDNSGR